jgi:hypothetical protein
MRMIATATRGPVTRGEAPRSMRSKSEVVGTFPSLVQFLESIKSQMPVFDQVFDIFDSFRTAAGDSPSRQVTAQPRA